MNYPKLKALKYKLIIPLLVFLFGTGVLCVVIYKISYTNQERVRDKAALNAVSYADRMIADLNNGITITKSLEQIIISENGQIEHFEKIAENMMTDSIQSIQLAPGGVVTDIYPEKGNDTGKIDGLEFNRVVYDENGEIADIIAGDFFICYAPPDRPDFSSLPDELIQKYSELFKTPKVFIRIDGKLIIMPAGDQQ